MDVVAIIVGLSLAYLLGCWRGAQTPQPKKLPYEWSCDGCKGKIEITSSHKAVLDQMVNDHLIGFHPQGF